VNIAFARGGVLHYDGEKYGIQAAVRMTHIAFRETFMNKTRYSRG
jgi:hypothetical protein